MGIDFTYFKGTGSGEVVEAAGHRDLGPTQVSVKITHCGVCGTDEHYRHVDQGLGHEGIGIITEIGSSVQVLSEFRVGDRVGMGWYHKFCGYCTYCVSGKQAEVMSTSPADADEANRSPDTMYQPHLLRHGRRGPRMLWNSTSLGHIGFVQDSRRHFI